MAEDLNYYLNLFVKNKRVFIFSGVLLFSLFLLGLILPHPIQDPSPRGYYALPVLPWLFGTLSAFFAFFVLTGVREIEKPDEKTFRYTYLSIVIGVALFLIPSILILIWLVNLALLPVVALLKEIPFLILGIFSAIPFQIPVVLKYRKYLTLFRFRPYVPDPVLAAFSFSLLPGEIILTLILVLRGFGSDYMRWIELGYFSSLLICILTFLLSLFLSYRKTLKVIEKDGEEIPMIRIR